MRRRVATIAIGLAAAGSAAALVATQLGGPEAPTAARPGDKPPVVLTAAMVRHLASASALALAHSGQAIISSSQTVDGVLQQTSTDNITFTGKNWNDSFSETFPATGGAKSTTQSGINRVVDGQAYDYFVAADGLAWYHDTGPNAVNSMHIPDPRKLLGEMAPGAAFIKVGDATIDGVQVEHLRATVLAGLPAIQIPGGWNTGKLTALDFWVDGTGVIRRMSLAFRQLSYASTIDLSKLPKNVRVVWLTKHKQKAGLVRAWLNKADGKIVIEVKGGASGAKAQIQVTSTTVNFLGIGQPQVIGVPAHAIPTYGLG